VFISYSRHQTGAATRIAVRNGNSATVFQADLLFKSAFE
jgi:hypothetical protein